MLNFDWRSRRNGTGIARRAMLQVGAFGFGGWGLSDLLRAESASSIRGSSKSIINIHLDGGPPHLDTIDPKPEAPVEIRGEFDSIETRLPGYGISELMPKVASIADRFVFIRSLVGSAGAHDPFLPELIQRPVVGITGLESDRLCWLAAGFEWARLSVQQIVWETMWLHVPFTIKTYSRRSTTIWGSMRGR